MDFAGCFMKPVIIRGAGLIGSLVAEKLARRNIPVVIVSRNPKRFGHGPYTVIDRADIPAQIEAVKVASAVVNLEGKNIASGIWTKKLKNEILASRKNSVAQLGAIVEQADNRGLVILQASATGYYGNRAEQILTESADPGHGFLADTCVAWESAALKTFPKTRLAIFRIAPVLSNKAGVFTVWRRFFRAFLGGRFGRGRQYFSWIHEHDMAELVVYYVEHFMPGVINAAAPEPVTNAYLTQILAEKFRRHAVFHVPEFVLAKLAGDFGREMLLASVRAVPKRALADGFTFTFEKFARAVEDLI
jgi:uncharacterized protein (TIGR01777 family)